MDALAPMLAEHQLPLVIALTGDLARETSGMDLFSGFAEEDFRTDAMTFVRYRLSTLAIIRQTDRGARRMFLADLRELERQAFPEMQLLMQLLAHFAPVQKQRVNPKDPTFEEVVLPVKLRDYKADFSCLGGFLKPNQAMANYVSKELIVGRVAFASPPLAFWLGAGEISLDFPRPLVAGHRGRSLDLPRLIWLKEDCRCRHTRHILSRTLQLCPGQLGLPSTQLR